ncbi:MAG: phage terminase large subunit [Patescibacteria group bacterium]|nr:phage terminase large subunit [Patescibacteria group bacterium]
MSTELPFDPSRLALVKQKVEDELELRRQRKSQAKRGGLIKFIRYFWDVLEPATPFVDGWPLEAICDHLEALTFKEIDPPRLLENVPPGFMKSLTTNVFWPAWEWGPINLPHLRYVAFSYSVDLTLRDNRYFSSLITSEKYRRLWGHRFSLVKMGEEFISNDKTGWKAASSIRGVGTGARGNRVLIDDPHNIKEQESETIRRETVRWFDESAQNRLNDLATDAIVVIMQRVHEEDVAGFIIAEMPEYTHVCIPMEFEEGRRCETQIGWIDPREEDGELAWPERFPENVLEPFRRRQYMWATQYQQRPEPRGGGIFKRDWWQQWTDIEAKENGVNPGHLPPMSYVIGILDTAYTEKEENDPCAMVVLGLWTDAKGNPQVMLKYAWEEWLEFNPLVEKVAQTGRDHQIDRLLIEAKASGISVAQELRRRYSRAGFSIEQVDPGKGDKVARAYAVTHVFEEGAMWAPGFEDGTWRSWAEKAIDQCAVFPKGAHDDVVDCVVYGLKYLRDAGLLLRSDEQRRRIAEEMEYQKPAALPYQA